MFVQRELKKMSYHSKNFIWWNLEISSIEKKHLNVSYLISCKSREWLKAFLSFSLITEWMNMNKCMVELLCF